MVVVVVVGGAGRHHFQHLRNHLERRQPTAVLVLVVGIGRRGIVYPFSMHSIIGKIIFLETKK